MKKVIIIVGIIIGIIVLILIAVPLLLQGNIAGIIEKQSAKYINADLKIGKVDLSMFKSFPDLNVDIKDVSVVGKEHLTNDTLAIIPLFSASVNLMSVIKGNEIIINKILLKDGKLTPSVSTNGKTNWDIIVKQDSSSTSPNDDSEGASTAIKFNDISISNLFLSYNDYQSSTYASIEALDLSVSGNFSESNTLVDLMLAVNNISFRQNNNVWLSNTDLNWNSEIAANLTDLKFNIQKNDLAINDLKLDLTGEVAIDKSYEKYNVNLNLNAPDTKFKSLLDLVPKSYQKYIEDIKTTGEFTLTAKAQGEYYTGHFPLLDIKLAVHDASVQYPELPESIQKINLDLNITNPGGPLSATLINLEHMSFTMAGNPFDMHMKIINPDDPEINGGIKGVINFMSLKKALPLKDITLQGVITTDITFDGKYQYIEKEQYEKFTAKGNVHLSNILILSSEFPKGISIPQGNITVTPAYLNLDNFQARINSSDFALKGNISNYLPYFLKNGTLKGNFSLASDLINLNEFRSAPDTAKAKESSKENAAQGALEVPRNLDIQLNTRIKTLLFDQLTVNNIQGNINLSNATATLNNLRMELLKGSMVMNGKYNTVDPQVPQFNFDLNISDFDINSAYNSFSFIKKSIPIAMNCNGKISSALKFSANLNKEMSLLMNTANGEGYVSSKGILINDNPAMMKLASILKNDELSRLSISSLKIDFKMQNGNITIEPFQTTFAGNPATIYGSQTIDGNIDYTISLNVDRKYFGKDINNLLKVIPGSDNVTSLDIDTKITGTLSKPEVKPNLTKAINALKKEAEKELKNKAEKEILKGLKKLFK